ncbi:HAD family hydrolase [uncultured Devosia sp.]|uniref:HAD family hydrolase n=1 Tax=uncultured Devosia sp. TaxID=211434 RepID=UPI00260D50D6|nr:HAD family hydrolase [uncultured Devosia sp.]
MRMVTELDLAAQLAPQLMLDAREPYRPVAMGYTVFREAGQSPSSKFWVEPAAAVTVEYAIYYDWDIGHLYDLEHVWVHAGADGQIVRVEASAHGGRLVMDAGGGRAEMRDGRALVYVEAGKHAHWASPDLMGERDRKKLAALCGRLAGLEGVHLGNPFAQRGVYRANGEDHRLARLKMRRDAFAPSHHYVPLAQPVSLMPWPAWEAAIPRRIEAELARLRAELPHLKAVLLDCGDTLVDERTEEKEPGSEVVLRGELIPGAAETMRALKDAGYRLVLVADGPRQSFVNLLGHHQLWDLFDAHVISEDVGALKPDARMFDTALEAVGLDRSDSWRCVMVGNNLSRDIKGAKALGIISVFMAWSSLRSHVAADISEHPDYTIRSPEELPALLEQLEDLLHYRGPAPFF